MRQWPASVEQDWRRQRVPLWKRAFPGLSWILVLAAAVVAVYSSGQLASVFAANPRPATGHEAEAALGAAHAEQRNNNCTLVVPANPLTAQGLATPYQLKASSSGNNNCHEATPAQAAFVQAAVLDPATGQISIYNPLVIDAGAKPAAAPVVPTLPANAVVGIWFGANGIGLRLQGTDAGTLRNANCVNGLGTSIFGQVTYCNAPAFFEKANQLIQQKTLTPPALGTANDGMMCPSIRDFSVVDQDQSDNVTATYLITQDGKMAQNTAANAATFTGSSVLANGSDNRLLAVALDGALGCTPWQAPDLANPGHMVPAQPLDELQAAMYQQSPVALVPSRDPMVLVNGQPNLVKQNLYRAGVDQPRVPTVAQAASDQKTYCQDLMRIAPARIEFDRPYTSARSSVDPAVANSLYTFLATRLAFTVGPSGLNCTGLLNQPNPVNLVVSNGVVVDATFATSAQPGA